MQEMTLERAIKLLKGIRESECTAWELSFLGRVRERLIKDGFIPARMAVTFKEIAKARSRPHRRSWPNVVRALRW